MLDMQRSSKGRIIPCVTCDGTGNCPSPNCVGEKCMTCEGSGNMFVTGAEDFSVEQLQRIHESLREKHRQQ